VRELEALDDCEGTILSDRRASSPYGLSGGASGEIGANSIVTGNQSTLLGGKAKFSLRPGDVLRVRTPGGAGWGA
jgi:N-methylhydantoinase B/oxoprolinase/acetone carboxylase alpha subunit